MTDALVAYLRALPDDWDSWLVYADRLSEAGDERGQLLVLEHQQQPVRGLAEAWMICWDDHLGRGQELPDEHLLANQWALPHLDEQGIHYYLPAVMQFALRHIDKAHAGDTWITESLAYTLQPSEGDLRAYQERRFARFDHAQRGAIYAFALVHGTPESNAAWGRLFEAEQAGPRADWFAIFNP